MKSYNKQQIHMQKEKHWYMGMISSRDWRMYMIIALILTCIIFLLSSDLSGPLGLRLLLSGLLIVLGIQYIFMYSEIIGPLFRLKQELTLLEKEEERVQRQKSQEILKSLTDNGDMLSGVIWSLVKNVNTHSEEKALNAEVALFALQSEINPHFLYNSLEVIRNKANRYGAEEISDMALALAKIFRYSISRPGETASLSEEIENVKNYVKIQQYRFPDKFDVVYDLDMADSGLLQCRLPVLTLQPIVENALNHGIEPMIEKGSIIIRAFISDRKLTVIVTDTGVGMTEDKLEEIRQRLDKDFMASTPVTTRHLNRKAGVSLNNVNNRLKIFFGNEYGLDISSCLGAYTTVEIVVPKVFSI